MVVRDDFSAGGLVRDAEGRIAVIRTRNLAGDVVWTLPKGHPDPGETPIDAAVREVAEETGIPVAPVSEDPLASIDYWFTDRDGTKVHKRVDYFAMQPTAGPSSPPDPVEVDEIAWLHPDEAAARLSYQNDRRVVEGVSAGD